MPDRDVKTLRDLINYQYSKIIACSAFKCKNGFVVKKKHYGFIKKTFRELKSGNKTWSEIECEDWQFVESEKECAYCGKQVDITREHIVPRSLQINDGCSKCDTIQSIHNQVWACKSCNSQKGTKGLYSFY
jgi:5-methylcytosine-specific restriction endonuclease McrA